MEVKVVNCCVSGYAVRMVSRMIQRTRSLRSLVIGGGKREEAETFTLPGECFVNEGWAGCPEIMKQLCADFDPALFFLLRWKNDIKKEGRGHF